MCGFQVTHSILPIRVYLVFTPYKICRFYWCCVPLAPRRYPVLSFALSLLSMQHVYGRSSLSTMRTFNLVFIILAVLSCTSIAMIGAMPTGNGTPAQALHLPQLYVHWQQRAEVQTRLKYLLSSPQRCEAVAGLCEICAQIDENKLQPRKICESKTCTAVTSYCIFWCKEGSVTARTSRTQDALTHPRPRPPIFNNSSAISVRRQLLTY